MKRMFLSEACLLLVILWTAVQYTSPIKCYVGYGQRGLKYSNEIKWIRNCPQSNYCFEAVAFDIEKVRKLINYPWNSYYNQFFVRSCGGDLGTQIEYRPYRGYPRSFRALGIVKINITVDRVITGHGGTEEFYLKHACRKNLCLKGTPASSAIRSLTTTRTTTLIVTIVVAMISVFLYA